MAMENGNGPGSKMEQVADSVTTRLLARLSMICLLPILGFLFYNLWEGQEKIADKLDAIDKRLVRVETRIDVNEMSRARDSRSDH